MRGAMSGSPILSVRDHDGLPFIGDPCVQGWGHRLDYGDVETCFSSGECDHIIEGTARIGGQEHFYLEPHCSVVIPQENDEICLYASTQVRNLKAPKPA